ncbi:MAG TPA: hypothetical protein VG916_10660 [Gemmatimonadaceae bacterium]|nr:hypothetical protein [Gemmatimonadaceae bacterium]
MIRRIRTAATALLAVAIPHTALRAQDHHGHLHVSNRWKECSIQLDPSLTPAAWKQFTEEAGIVAYFRPIADARPMGRGRFDLSMMQYKTSIDDAAPAWNDTFVHPDSTHWLFEGDGLKFPGLVGRYGLTDRTDVGVYFTQSPGANYGFYGAEVQHAFMDPRESAWGVAARISAVSLFGPDDVDLTVAGFDVLASRTIRFNGWASVSPYAGWSSYLSHSHEKSPVVDLADQTAAGSFGTMGATVQLSWMKIGVEYNAAKVRSTSLKIGFGT